MSFGASPSDIIIVVTFARRLYKQCKNAGGEYLEISREVRGLHTVLRHLKDEVEDPESVLNRDRSQYAKELAPVIGDCDYTLLQLDNLLQKYGRLGREKDGSGNRLWDKIRFGSAEMDELGSLRVKLINHKTSITVFLDTIQLHQSGRVSAALDIHGEKLDLILDKVDKVAARMASRLDGGRSVLTTYDDDDKEVWKQFRRELVQEGFSSDVLTQHKVGHQSRSWAEVFLLTSTGRATSIHQADRAKRTAGRGGISRYGNWQGYSAVVGVDTCTITRIGTSTPLVRRYPYQLGGHFRKGAAGGRGQHEVPPVDED
jgi:hypothetical protein